MIRRPKKAVHMSTLKLLVGLFLDWYEGILVFCHVIAVSLDPLFFYVPVIKEDKRCIELNNVLWTIAIVLRSVTDVVYLVHFVVKSVVKSKIRKERNDESNSKEHSDESRVKGRRYFWPFFMLNILVILPIPQVKETLAGFSIGNYYFHYFGTNKNDFYKDFILPIPHVLMSKILSEMRRAKYTNYVTILNAVILSQYVPRVLQIYLSLKELGKNKIIPIRIRASFNFFLYILAGYIFGAFWYFFTTQRLTYCWRKACLYHGGCVQGSFNCDHSFGNFSVSHDFCSIDTTNTRAFDFGIFLEARQSGILESTDFPKKLIYTAWWGLRNLSSFGSNLQTSACIWENAFAFGISMLGLLLFLYLLGNLQ
ncbi:cyclic nucleotide-gated ion channel 1, partial [Quercus suber]